MKILNTKKLYSNSKYKIPKSNIELSIIKDIRKKFKKQGLKMDYLSDKKICKLYDMILDFSDYKSITLNQAINKIKGVLTCHF